MSVNNPLGSLILFMTLLTPLTPFLSSLENSVFQSQGLAFQTKHVFKAQGHLGIHNKLIQVSNTSNELRTQVLRAASRKNILRNFYRVAAEIECKKKNAKNATTNQVGCAQPNGATNGGLPKKKDVSGETVKGNKMEPATNTSGETNINEWVRRYLSRGQLKRHETTRKKSKGFNQSDNTNHIDLNLIEGGELDYKKNLTEPQATLDERGAQLPDFEEETPAEAKKMLELYNDKFEFFLDMLRNTAKDVNSIDNHKSYIDKHKNYFKENQSIEVTQQEKNAFLIDSENMENTKGKNQTVNNQYPINNILKTQIRTKYNNQEKQIKDYHSAQFNEYQGGQFKSDQEGQFSESQGGMSNKYLGGRFQSDQEGQFSESQSGMSNKYLGGQLRSDQDSHFSKSLITLFKKDLEDRFNKYKVRQFKSDKQGRFNFHQGKFRSNQGGRFDNSFRVQQTQSGISNVMGDTDIVNYILPNTTQTMKSDHKTNTNPTHINYIQYPAQGTHRQNKSKVSKMWYQDKTVTRRLLEVDEGQQAPTNNNGVKITCTKEGFMRLQNAQLHSTDTIKAVKAVASNGITWNWVGAISSNDFLIPLSSVSIIDILYNKETTNEIKAMRVYVPWMPSASTGTCRQFSSASDEWKNFSSASDQWHGVHIKVTPNIGGMGEFLQVLPDKGMRITRIITTETTNMRAMQLLSVAKTRKDIMSICMEYKDSCIQQDHNTLFEKKLWRGWEQASLENSLHSPDSVLWVVDLMESELCQAKLGSWLLASMPSSDHNHISTLFTKSVDRMCKSPQAMALIRPGFAWPKLKSQETPHALRSQSSLNQRWSITFIELENVALVGSEP